MFFKTLSAREQRRVAEVRVEEATNTKCREASEKSLITYQRTASALRRILKELGLQRRAKVVGPSLGELLHQDAIHQQRAHTERSEAQRQEFEKRQSSRDQEAQS